MMSTRLKIVAAVILVVALCYAARGKTVEGYSHATQDTYEVIESLNDHPYAFTAQMQKLLQNLNLMLRGSGYELISIGDTQHYSLINVTIRHIASGRFSTCKSIMFLPNPNNGHEVGKILIDLD